MISLRLDSFSTVLFHTPPTVALPNHASRHLSAQRNGFGGGGGGGGGGADFPLPNGALRVDEATECSTSEFVVHSHSITVMPLA